MSKPTDDSDDDFALFRQSVGETKPITRDKVEPFVERPKPDPKFRAADDAAVLRESLDPNNEDLELYSGDHLRHRQPSVSDRVLRRLGRGHYRIDAELDLHGLTELQAREVLANFIREARQHGKRVVRVVHGKGLGSGLRGPVLKRLVNRRLRKSAEVLAFVSTPPTDGGTGAVYVLLDHD